MKNEKNTTTLQGERIASAKIGITKRFAKTLLTLFLLLGMWISLPYADTPIYVMPKSQPFAGSAWYNPYHTVKIGRDAQWKKVNFHAHSSAWRGLSHGISTTDSLFAIYDKLGYDFASVSQYQRIEQGSTTSHSIPCYEHGYGLWKNHQIIINTQQTPVWRDYILGQTVHHKQSMLEYLHRHDTTSIIVLAHPALRNAYTEHDMVQIIPPNGFGILEPFNFNVESIALWDSALSAGRIYWGVGHDDTHNIFNPEETGVCWTMLADGLHSYRTGAFYAVKLRSSLPDRWRGFIDSLISERLLAQIPFDQRFGLQNAQNDATLVEQTISKDSLRNPILIVTFSTPVACIQFIGQNGIVRQQSKQPTQTMFYRLRDDDTYIRVVAHTQNNTMLLNPVIRVHKEQILPHTPPPNVDRWYTTLHTMAWCVIYAVGGVSLVNLFRWKRDNKTS